MPQQNQGLQQQVQFLQALQAQGVPQDQWAPLLAVLVNAGGGAAAAQPVLQQNGGYGRDDPSRDHNGYSDSYNVRSPSGRYRDRSRSRSPGGYRHRDASPPRRRDSPLYGNYGRGDSRRQGGGGRGSEYRRRSPQDNYRRSDSPRGNDQRLPPPGPKNIQYDHSLPPNNIKGKFYMQPHEAHQLPTHRLCSPKSNPFCWWSHVSNPLSCWIILKPDQFLSSSEDVLRGIFSAFGLVQTCIVNVDKRHAFVKMLTRKDAQQAKDGMERYKSPDMQLRVSPDLIRPQSFPRP